MLSLFERQLFVADVRIRRHGSRVVIIDGHHPPGSLVPGRFLVAAGLPRVRASASVSPLVTAAVHMFHPRLCRLLVLVVLLFPVRRAEHRVKPFKKAILSYTSQGSNVIAKKGPTRVESKGIFFQVAWIHENKKKYSGFLQAE